MIDTLEKRLKWSFLKMAELLSQSPLIYVLGQVKITPILNIEEYVSQIQDLLRDDLPEFNNIMLHEVQFQNKEPTQIKQFKQWHFSNIENTHGVLVQADAITIHTTDYHTFKEFFDLFYTAISKIHQTLNIGAYTRIGIRYINLIADNIDDYVNNAFLGFRFSEEATFISSREFFNKVDSINDTHYGALKVQAVHTFLNKLPEETKKALIPPDLLPTANLIKPKINKAPTDEFVILDIDHFTKTQPSKFNIDEICSRLEQLNSCVYQAFKMAVSDKAIEAWR